jgi:YfiH family protein
MRRPRGAPDPLTPARHKFAQAMRVDPARITYAGAVHGAQVARVDEPRGVVDGVDALVTDRPGLPLLALYADCFPLILYSPERACAALGHAGWRGTAAGIAGAMVQALHREYGCEPAELLAGIGPGICAGCYEVGEEVARCFPAAVTAPSPAGRHLLDLAAANRLAWLESGLDPARIRVCGVCTRESGQLYSHRRDADGSRFAGLLALR